MNDKEDREENDRYIKMKEEILKNIERAIEAGDSVSTVSWIEALEGIDCKIEIV